MIKLGKSIPVNKRLKIKRMKIKSSLLVLFFSFIFFQSNAQHVEIRMNFPVGVSVSAPGPSPYRGGIWIGPEWRWDRGQYVHESGYWAKPKGRHHQWIPGHWQYSRKGYYWVPGRWKR